VYNHQFTSYMKKTFLFLIVTFTMTIGFGQENKDANEPVSQVNLYKTTALEFIQFLAIKDGSKTESNQLTYPIPVVEVEVGWIKDSDIDSLILLIDSKEPARCIMTMRSSYWPNESSTIGGHAMNMIDAFRFKRVYPYSMTECPKNNETRKKEILNWYKTYKKKQK